MQLKGAAHAVCCRQFEELPQNVKCFLPDICAELEQLCFQHRKAFVARPRLLQLAQPMCRTVRHVPQCPCKFRKPIEIIRLDERRHTRTEQLAYPLVRRLLLFKRNFGQMLTEQRVELLNRLIRKSLLSLYSRLANVQPPQERAPLHKWDKAEWDKHKKYLKKLAKHKVERPPPTMPSPSMPLKKMKRYKTLALPKRRTELGGRDWVFTAALRHYKATERIAELAKHKVRDEDALYRPLPPEIPPGALKYKATKRIQELATPYERRAGESDVREDAFTIPKNALKAKASQRVEELAEPVERKDTHTRENPMAISKAALKAEASPRIIELAKPKKSN